MAKNRTPLRYPGGKQKIAPFIIEIIRENDLSGGHYVEPYAGGAGVAIELLLNGIVSNIHLNDSNKAVYAFWHSILNETEVFCRKISRASLNVEEWKKQKDVIQRPQEFTRLELGFAFFYLNRCNRSGIVTGGLIGGLNQDGRWKMDARFPRVELTRRIEAIASKNRYIKLRNWDADRFIINYLPKLPINTLVYCDPPYIHKAEKLYYDHYTIADHQRISKIIQKQINHPWIVSYDNVPIILEYYKRCNKFVYSLQYNAAKVYQGFEIFIFSDKLKIPKNSSITYIDKSLKEYVSV
jgi:DNA adenine methylase